MGGVASRCSNPTGPPSTRCRCADAGRRRRERTSGPAGRRGDRPGAPGPPESRSRFRARSVPPRSARRSRRGSPSAPTQPSSTSGRRAARRPARAWSMRGAVPFAGGSWAAAVPPAPRTVHRGRTPASQIRPHDHPFHLDPDLDPQCIDPHPPLPQRVDVPPRLEPLPVVDELPRKVGHRRPERRPPLDEHVLRPVVGGVGACMKGDRDVRVAPDPVELLRCPHRAVHGHHSVLAVVDAEVRNGRQHDAGGGRDIGESDGVVAIDGLFDRIRPWGNTGRHVSKRVSGRGVQ